MWRAALTLLLLWASPSEDYLRAKQKFRLIDNGSARPGSSIVLSSRELNAYVREEVKQAVPDGLRNPRLELGNGKATGYALMDFVKLRESKGMEAGWLMKRLLAGERPVRVTALIHSSRGQATVEVEQVEISGLTVSGAALDFLIENFLLPRYPDAKIGDPFELKHGIDRLEIRPAGVRVILKN